MPIKRAEHLFLKITFFFSLYSFSLPPKHFLIIFSGKLATKNGKKNSRKEEKIFFLFFIIFFTFSLSPYGKKQNHLLFPPFLSPKIEKPQGKTYYEKFFLFFFLTFLHPTAPRTQKNYHLPFFSKFRLKVPFFFFPLYSFSLPPKHFLIIFPAN